MDAATRAKVYAGTPEEQDAAYAADAEEAARYGWVPTGFDRQPTSMSVTYTKAVAPPPPPVVPRIPPRVELESQKKQIGIVLGFVIGAVVLLALIIRGSATGPKAVAPLPTFRAAGPVGCSPASAALMAALTEGIDVSGPGSFRNGYTVKSSDYVKVWFLGAEVVAEGVAPGEAVGIWATNDLNGNGFIYSVDGFANSFSQWGDGTRTDAHLSMFDAGAQEAKACAGG